jgi:RNA polymerase sigma-70 factor (ECF subfamily)
MISKGPWAIVRRERFPTRNQSQFESYPMAESSAMDNPFDLNGIVRRYENALLRYVTQLIGSADDEPEDVVQETFLKLHDQMRNQGADSVKHVSSWLFRVAHNLAMDRGRRRSRQAKLQKKLSQDPLGQPLESSRHHAPSQELSRREACDLAMSELQRLPEEQKNVVLLKIIQGFTLREISEVTSLKMGTVNYRLTQGLRELSRRLKQAGAI